MNTENNYISLKTQRNKLEDNLQGNWSELLIKIQ